MATTATCPTHDWTGCDWSHTEKRSGDLILPTFDHMDAEHPADLALLRVEKAEMGRLRDVAREAHRAMQEKWGRVVV